MQIKEKADSFNAERQTWSDRFNQSTPLPCCQLRLLVAVCAYYIVEDTLAIFFFI